MKKILFATENPAKAKRFAKGLLENGIELVTLNDISTSLVVEENGKDAIENALIKAKAYYNETKMVTMAMDDNLYIDNIPANLQPQTFVRRINGKRLSDEEMIEHYSALAHNYGENGKLTARWVSGIAVVNNGIAKTYTICNEDFNISEIPTKKITPGYPLNSISIDIKLDKYFTDITEEDKGLVDERENGIVDFITRNA